MWGIGALSQNDIREKEDMDPIDGGDAYFVPLNMQPLSWALQEPVPPEPTEPTVIPAGSNRWAIKHKREIKRVLEMVKNEDDEGPAMEDWEYLIHHIHVDEDTGEEIIHHCPMLDHLGNLYSVEHLEGEDGEFYHILSGLMEDQEVIWSDEQAEEDGFTVPCPDRQL